MLESLNQIDQAVFFFINASLQNPVTNFIMPVITNHWVLRALYAVAMLALLWKGNARLRWLVLFSVVALVLADQIAAGYLKPLIARPRPCHGLDGINLLVGCGGGYAMPSAHAASSFGQAALFSFHYRRFAGYMYAFAAIVALSRVFVGVHYPGDIFAGAALGMIIGLVLAVIFTKYYAAVSEKFNRDK